jgi:FG-GAP-like repeat/FG-GAP repeat
MSRLIASFALLLIFSLPLDSQAQQYTPLVLPAPAGAPGGETRAMAMNNLGQIYGIAGVVNFAPPSYVPVVWTNGVPSILSFPSGSGYHLDEFGFNRTDFINDSGTVVSGVINDAVLAHFPNDGRRPLVWQNGTPTILPLPSTQVCTNFASAQGITGGFGVSALDRLNGFSIGLNNQNQVLLYACGAFWIWQSGNFDLLVQQDQLGQPFLPQTGNHLNDAGHAPLEVFGTCPAPLPPFGFPCNQTKIYSLGNLPFDLPVFPGALNSLQINNNEQILAFITDPSTGQPRLHLRNGAQFVDLGLGGAAALNNLGEVVFSTPFPFSSRIYKNGVISPLNVPAPLSGGFLFNDAGQIVANTSLTVSQPYAVLFTPTTPPTPALGNYPDTSVPLSGNTTIAPDAAPTNTTSINISTSTDFKGKMEGDPSTGSVRVTDAHPAGTYIVTIKAFIGGTEPTATKTFTLTVTTPPTCNPVSFAAPVNIGVGAKAGQVLVGDFNGDGRQDLAVAELNGTAILLGDGTGGFTVVTELANVGARAVGDFNGDGKQDLAILNASNVVILFGDGTGHFVSGSNFDTGCTAPFQLAVGDFNGDSKLDMAFACFFSDAVTIVLGNGAGGFSTAASFGVSDGPQGLAVGDVNGDGRQDLAVACMPAGVISILLGDGAGTFAASMNFNAGATPRDIEIGDFNGDGSQDLAFSNPSFNAASVMLGSGVGGFGAPTTFAVGSNPTTEIAVGDFNGDGKQDLAVPNFGSNDVSILLANGTGSFGAAINFSVGLSPFGVVVGDFNGDGMQDLATANWDSNDVSILLRDCAPAETQINSVITSINNSALVPDGIKTSLNAKLQDALAALESGDIATACTKLQDVQNEIRAQRGKKIPVGQADTLRNSVIEIRAKLGCG